MESDKQFFPISYSYTYVVPNTYNNVLKNKVIDETNYADAAFEESSNLDIAKEMLYNIGVKS